MNVGPESRSQPRSVAALKNCTRVEFHPRPIEQVGNRALHRATGYYDVHGLDAAEMADDLGVDPGNGRELARPVVAVVRPGDPGRLVRLPFGGHAVAKLGGGVRVRVTSLDFIRNKDFATVSVRRLRFWTPKICVIHKPLSMAESEIPRLWCSARHLSQCGSVWHRRGHARHGLGCVRASGSFASQRL